MANGERCVMAILTTMKPKSPALCSDLGRSVFCFYRSLLLKVYLCNRLMPLGPNCLTDIVCQ